jgi:CRP-like cAMP-binding protein
MLQFLRRLAGSLECAEEKISDPGADGVRRRVLRLIAGLRLAYASTEAGGETTLDLPLSRSDIAAAVGATPRALAAVLRRLEAEGMVAAGTDSLRILDPDRLRTAVRDDAPAVRA